MLPRRYKMKKVNDEEIYKKIYIEIKEYADIDFHYYTDTQR